MNNRGFFLDSIDKEHTWHPFQLPYSNNIQIKKAKGVYLHDVNNKKYIDAISSWWVNIHGHGNLRLKNALNRQFKKTDHIIFSGFTHEPSIRLTKELISRCGKSYGSVFYSDNGSTCVEVALKMAFQYLKQKGNQTIQVISFENAYHGDTFGAMSLAGPSIFNKSFSDLMFKPVQIPLPTVHNLNEIKEQLKKELKPNASSIFIYEPLLQGSGGMNMYEAKPMSELLSFLKSNQTITIADEVLTGFYRTGTFLASDQINALQTNIQPDFICLSKAITGGVLPLGATVIKKEVVDWFSTKSPEERFYHGHSYTGNALACAVAVESLKLIDNNVLSQLKMIQQEHEKFAESNKNNSSIKKIKVCGTVLRMEFQTENETGYTNSIRDVLYNFFLEKGILLRPLGNVIYVLPPYCITRKELSKIYSTLLTFESHLVSKGK